MNNKPSIVGHQLASDPNSECTATEMGSQGYFFQALRRCLGLRVLLTFPVLLPLPNWDAV